jgi:hypothetical protein
MIDGDPIYVIEPHSDDAFLSLGWSMRLWLQQGRRVEIVTVHSVEEDRHTEAKAFADAIGAGWRGLDVPAASLADIIARRPLAPLPDPLLPEEMLHPSACRIWPFGLLHVEHQAVAARAGSDLHYLDLPYMLDLENQDEVAAQIAEHTIVWWRRPPPEKWDDAALFPSQAALFKYYPIPGLVGVPEIVVR